MAFAADGKLVGSLGDDVLRVEKFILGVQRALAVRGKDSDAKDKAEDNEDAGASGKDFLGQGVSVLAGARGDEELALSSLGVHHGRH